jgi:hypothetical protein
MYQSALGIQEKLSVSLGGASPKTYRTKHAKPKPKEIVTDR